MAKRGGYRVPLSQEEREAIVKLYIDGKTQKEIAQAVNRSPNSVSRVLRGVNGKRRRRKPALQVAKSMHKKIEQVASDTRKTYSVSINKEAHDTVTALARDYDITRAEIVELLLRRELKHRWVPEYRKMAEELI